MNINEPTPKSNPSVRVAYPHDSAHKHVSGEARYGDDMLEPRGTLQVYVRLAQRAHANVSHMDLTAVRATPGVAAVISATDIASTTNDIGPVFPGDQVFVDGEVLFHGQPLFAVAADSIDEARRAAMKAEVEYEDLDAILSVDDALAADAEVVPPKTWERGNPTDAIETAANRINDRTELGGQEHFYLEGQVALAVPQEDGDMLVHSSTQHPSEVQHAVAKVLGLADHAVTVETRRMGGGFGGKETQGAQFAVIASLVSQATGRAVKHRLDRDDDMTITGKRHGFVIDYDVGFDDDGRISGMKVLQAADCGYAPDLSHSVCDRAMYHADNAYYLANSQITSKRCRTHKVSNTAFRGFGGPQGMVGMEQIIEEIARHVGKDPLDVRKINFYGIDERNVTPYGMTVRDNILHDLVPALESRVDYAGRRQAVREYNATSPYLKKGLSLTPVKFGISFTAKFLNQAGALVLVYTDGSVQLNHGGTEMGQGLNIKVAQVVAEVFGIDIDKVRITATNTGKVPNTSATAASSGSDLNGAAAYNGAVKIIDRLLPLIRDQYGLDADDKIEFRDNAVFAGDRKLDDFVEIVKLAYFSRIQLSASGFYATPKLEIDELGCGRPFFYFAYGAACTEVLVDTLTGEHRMTRVDILHDVGKSLNPAVDMGQIEGGFVQGAGWLTTEELSWDQSGRIGTHAPSTYKIPVASDVPEHFNAEIYERGDNVEEAVYRSKAVGEPPLMLSLSVLHAVKDAVASIHDYRHAAPLNAPATPEAVLLAIQKMRATEPTPEEALIAEEAE